ncbi:hypothetical protein M513_09997 [Trichuris suis]|uniref:Uncharacterized protein n=1 Tax=Trichuris suis TaxID=68888 RepID=A0A085LW27_9BILA|nr:hypothetical protein M513_09997 [Trichuris suis]
MTEWRSYSRNGNQAPATIDEQAWRKFQRAYGEVYARRIREARQLGITSFFKPSASTAAAEEARQYSVTEEDM